MSVDEAKKVLGVKGNQDNFMLWLFLGSIQSLIEETTGYKVKNSYGRPIALKIVKVHLKMLYKPHRKDFAKLSTTSVQMIRELEAEVNRRNSAYLNGVGYYDPTAGAAITNADNERKGKRRENGSKIRKGVLQ